MLMRSKVMYQYQCQGSSEVKLGGEFEICLFFVLKS